MPRRWIETGVAVVAVIALGLVLYNATLVDRRPPTVSRFALSAAAGGDDQVAQTLTAIDLTFSEPVDRASVEQRFRIEPYVGGTFTWDRNTTAIFTPAQKLPSATEFTVVVAAGFADTAGNLAQSPAGPFQFRTVGPPIVVSMSPDATTAGVATDAVVRLAFDRLMDTGSVEAALSIEPFVPFRVSWTGPSLTMAFRSALAFGTTYTVTVGSDAADTDGGHLVTPFTGAFTTVAAGLGVDAVVPADGVAGIGVRSPIAVAFDGPIDPASVQGAIRITPPIGGQVAVVAPASDTPVPPEPSGGSAAPSGGASGSATDQPSMLVFTPSALLAEHTTYTVELLPIVRRAGDPGQVAAGRTWRFTTGGQANSVQNQIAFLSTRGGVRNVWLMNPDGTNPRQVTTELAPVSAFDASSDGRTLVYATAGVVRALRLDGGDAATVTEPGIFEYAPTVAPGGGTVLVGRRDATGADMGWWLEPLPGAPGSTRQVYPFGAPPTGSAAIAGDGLVVGPGVSAWTPRAAFDPTGRWLLLVLADGRVVHADVVPSTGAPVATLLDITASTGVPAWDGANTAFVLTGSGTAGAGLLRIGPEADTSALVFAAVGPAVVAGHGGITTLVAPAGDHIGYTSLATRAPEALTSAPDLLDRSPGFSPDGTTLVFGRVPALDPTRSAGIWLCGLDGRDLRQLSTDGAAARWLP